MVFGCICDLELIIWPAKLKNPKQSYEISYKILLHRNAYLKRSLTRYADTIIDRYETIENFKNKIYKSQKSLTNEKPDMYISTLYQPKLVTIYAKPNRDLSISSKFKEKKDIGKPIHRNNIFTIKANNKQQNSVSLRNVSEEIKGDSSLYIEERRKLQKKTIYIANKEKNQLKIYINSNVYFVK